MKYIQSTFAIIFIFVVSTLDAQKDCNTLNKGLIPMTDLGNANYKGFTGGLFGDGVNEKSGDHLKDALLFASQVKSLDSNGLPNENGKIGFIAVGASNPRTEFNAFLTQCDTFSDINSNLLFVNTCIGGQGIQKMKDINDNYWKQAAKMLDSAKLNSNQVQIAWLETDNTANGDTLFPGAAYDLADELRQLLSTLKILYPNLKICYLAARAYSGYAQPTPGGVGKGLLYPRDYYGGWANRFLIDREKSQTKGYEYKGLNASIPFTTWGNYSWSNANEPRNDGFFLDCDLDVGGDGLHLTALGEKKIGNLIFNFFKSDTSSKSWFIKNSPLLQVDPKMNASDICIYPNPGNGQSIKILNYSNGKRINIRNSHGQLIQGNENCDVFSLASFPNGLYFIELIDSEGQIRSLKYIKTD